MRHEARIDQILHPELLQLGVECGLFERAWVILHDHRLAFKRCHHIGDLPDRRADIIGVPGPASCMMWITGRPAARKRLSKEAASFSASSTPTSCMMPSR